MLNVGVTINTKSFLTFSFYYIFVFFDKIN